MAAVLFVIAVVVAVRLVGSRAQSERPPQNELGPVLLIPGYGGSQDALAVLAGRIRATGRDAEVLTLPGNGTGDLAAQAAVLKAAVDAAPSVDVIGYSAGGVVAGLWVARFDGATKARRVVTLGSPLHGAHLAEAGAALAPDACPPACRQLAPGSAVLAELDRAAVATAVPWLSVWTADDETVIPPQSARLAGAVNVELQAVCPGAWVAHWQLPTDPLVTGLVLRALGTEPLREPDTSECGSLRAVGTP
jgi:triacylglycerol esterase/lipase EstA (alpha/beta hydrolase family)